MRVAIYAILWIISANISDIGYQKMRHVTDTLGPVAEFSNGQWTYMIAGLFACVFFFATFVQIVKKVW
jgi:hypothetical protein